MSKFSWILSSLCMCVGLHHGTHSRSEVGSWACVLSTPFGSLDQQAPVLAQSTHQAQKWFVLVCELGLLFVFLVLFSLFYVYDCFDGEYMCVPCACLVRAEVRRRIRSL